MCGWLSLPTVRTRGPARSWVKFGGCVAWGWSGQQMGAEFSPMSPSQAAGLRQSCFVSHPIWWLLLSLFLREKL